MKAHAYGMALIVCAGLAAAPRAAQAQCTSDKDCDDGLFCNGIEMCDLDSGACGAVSACPPAIDGCVTRNATCDEDQDLCVDFADDSLCDNGHFCDGIESCDIATGDCVAISSCPPFIDGCLTTGPCNEETQSCPIIADNSLCSPGEACDLDGDCLTPQQLIEDLLASLTAIGDVHPGAPTRSLRRALNSLQNGQPKAACNALSGFLDVVAVMVAMGDLTEEQGESLTVPVANVMAALGCT